jgi:hypothetical protein
VEHRINTIFYGRELRFWIESQVGPNFDGIEDPQEAASIIGHAVDSAYLHFGHNTKDLPKAKDIVLHFLEKLAFTNAVEWVPGSTPGGVAYRDWP